MQDQPNMPLRQRYLTLAIHSRRMCEAARKGNWDELIKVTHLYTEALNTIEQMPPVEPLNAQDRIACQLELANVLALNEETDRLAKIELKDLRNSLTSLRTSSRLNSSYGRMLASSVPTPRQ